MEPVKTKMNCSMKSYSNVNQVIEKHIETIFAVKRQISNN